ncbi:MAG: hypothetical protein AB1801_00225 [Chloroflexota bacterium]
MFDKTDLSTDWALWLGWVLANIAGAVAGFPLAMAALWVVTVMGIADERAIFPYVLFPVVGICIGGMQWLILRRYTTGTNIWVLATAAVWPFCYAFLGLAIRGAIKIGGVSFTGPASWVVTFALIGAALGGIQWLVLRRHFSQAGWWVLASAAGFAAFGPLGDILLLIVLLGAIPGATTGAALVWLLRQSLNTEQAI